MVWLLAFGLRAFGLIYLFQLNKFLSGESLNNLDKFFRQWLTPASAEEYAFPSEKAPQLGRELSWKWNRSSPSLAFNPLGISTETTLFGTIVSTVRVLASLTDSARPSYVPLIIPLFVHRSYIPFGLLLTVVPKSP